MVLALLHHIGADAAINTLLTPVTAWWLGLPLVLGVPILFGVLRKGVVAADDLSGAGHVRDRHHLLDWVQITTFLLFLTFYIPCISTFAVMLKTIGRKRGADLRGAVGGRGAAGERGGAPAARRRAHGFGLIPTAAHAD